MVITTSETAKPGERPDNITARGTVRVNRTPNGSEGYLQLGGRIHPDLKKAFLRIVNSRDGINQSAALTEAIQDWVVKHDNDSGPE